MSRVTIADWYGRVNETWDAHGAGFGMQALSPEESIKAAKKIYRFMFGKSFPGDVRATSGRRVTWIRRGVMSVNPDRQERNARGLRALVHDLSHYGHFKLYPGERPHSGTHARLEIRIIKQAIARGWLEGALAPPAPVPEPEPSAAKAEARQRKIDALGKRLEAWERKQRRAENAIKKIRRSLAAYARADARKGGQ